LIDPKQNKKIKNILNSIFTLSILGAVWSGKRPIQIARSLKTSPQVVSYHIRKLIKAGLIFKGKDRNGRLMWRLTERGSFFLKENLTRSVNNNSSTNSGIRSGVIPIRLDNTTFSFKIKSIPENLHLNWISMNNSVTKSVMKFKDHTEEIIKSPKDHGSVLLIHMPQCYCYDPDKTLVKQYDAAHHFSQLTAQRLMMTIAETGDLVTRPHKAFEHDVIAMFLATFETAEVATEGGKTWIDSSTGRGELETNDSDVYNYLKMPEIVREIYNELSRMKQKLAGTIGYRKYYDPTLTENN
jgi:DNA-binding PadR family transcriptional regulator